jgi:hypothetical protein
MGTWKSALTSGGLSLIALLGLAFAATQAIAAPVEYVKVCSLYGPGYFYIPGTADCVSANQINETQAALSKFTSTAYTGIAVSTAIVTPYVPPNANFAFSAHWGGFEGANAVGFGGLMRAGNSNFFLSAGVGTGINNGATAERAGFMMAW